jgi:transcriptional regulator with XRE-family HTH domain
MPGESAARRPAQIIGERVRLARRSRDWLQSDLAGRLEALGSPGWRQSKVAKLEKGEVKRVSLDEVLALAAALGVQLSHLLTPDEGDVEIAGKVIRPAREVRHWLRGFAPLFPEDEKNYFTGALVPPDEWRDFVKGVGRAGAAVVSPGAVFQTDSADDLRARFGDEPSGEEGGEDAG